MAMLQMTLQNLAELKGGLLERMLAAAINRMAIDIQSAPEIPHARKVTLEISAKPVMEGGELSDVVVEFAVTPKVPSRITSARMEVRATTNGSKQLFFSLDSPDNPSQKSLLENQ